jgi:hypothetical protein
VTTLAGRVADPWFPFEDDGRVEALQPRQVPEPDRDNLTGAEHGIRARDDSHYLWTDAPWPLRGFGEPCQLAGVVLPVWMDVLPAQPDSAKAAALTWVGAAMAAGDRARD